MVSAIIDIDEKTNRILNMIKAKFGLKDKSQAIDMMAMQYEQEILEPALKPEYARQISRIRKSRHLSRAEFEKEV